MFEKHVTLLDIDEIELMLSGDISEELVEEYYRFGCFALSDIQNAGNQVEGKLTALLGLATGMVAFLLFGTSLRMFAPAKVWIASAAASATLALVAAVVGLMSRMWRSPSEADWFKQELRDAVLLKKYHIVSLLAAHRQRLQLFILKSDCLRIAEILMALSVLILVAALLIATIS